MEKVIIITDPCYILTEKESDLAFENYDQSSKNLESILNDTYGESAIVADTGVGDWKNEVFSDEDKFEVKKHDFKADSGLVCAFITDNWNPKLDKVFLQENPGEAAVIKLNETVDLSDVKINMNTENPEWTLVEIFYKNKLVSHSIGEDEDYYDFEI